MNIVYDLEDIPSDLSKPIVLTIGNFDGVHLGHQYILKNVREKAGPTGSSVVLTFQTHPQHFFDPENKIPLISTLEEKTDLLESCDVDLIIALPFDQSTAECTYDDFLSKLRSHLPFNQLVLGTGATLGKDRGGTEETLRAYGGKHGFSLEYIQKYKVDNAVVSSRTIRTLLSEGKKKEAEQLLGHHLQ